eukprot:gene9446-10435_t
MISWSQLKISTNKNAKFRGFCKSKSRKFKRSPRKATLVDFLKAISRIFRTLTWNANVLGYCKRNANVLGSCKRKCKKIQKGHLECQRS